MENKKYTRNQLEEKLTQKEKIYCKEYIKDWNKSRAARAAGYSEENARHIGFQNSTKIHIQEYIDYIKDDIAEEAGISKLMLINELKLLAFANIPSIIEKYKTKGVEGLTEEEQRCVAEYSDHTKMLKNEGGTQILDNNFKLKGYDKRGCIQDIMKAMGWNEPDKHDITTQGEKISQQPDISRLSPEDQIAFLELRRKSMLNE